MWHFFLQNEVVTEVLDAVEALQSGLLGYQEEDASLLQAFDVALQQVVAYKIEICQLLLLQVFADDVGFRVESDAVFQRRMCFELKVMPFFSVGCAAKKSSSICVSSLSRLA